MAVLTTLQQLEAVQTAITNILTQGQSFAIGARQTEHPVLASLYRREKELLSQYNLETHGKARNKVRFEEVK